MFCRFKYKNSSFNRDKQLHSICQRSLPYLQIRHHLQTGHMFDEKPHPKEGVSWTSLISSLSQYRQGSEQALRLASHMRSLGIALNSYTLVCLIRASSNLGWIWYAQQLHSCILKAGFHSHVLVATALIGVYVRWEHFEDAHCMFAAIPQPNVVSWNSLISGYVRSGQYLKALGLVSEVFQSNLRPDHFTFSAALTACNHPCLLDLGRLIHCNIVKFGFESSIVAGNCLIDMYGKCGRVFDAILEFHVMKNKDGVSWNSVIGAAAQNRRVDDALDLLHQMPIPDTISYNEVISSLAEFGDMEDARKILSVMPNPNSSSWNSIIAGYIKQNQPQQALDFFSKMHLEGIPKDQFTFASILRGVSCLSALNWGTLIHCCTIKSCWDSCTVVGSALIDMYSKCGQVKDAETIFRSLPIRNLVTWNAMISGHANNGNTKEVLWMFEHMKATRSLRPDHITFVGVLSACGQDGLIGDGIRYFEHMTGEYGIHPTAEHCSCMIHLLGQGGDILRAHRMIYELGFQSCGLVWRALLGACRACGDVKVAEVAAAKVLALEGDDEFVYILMSNLYATHGRWSDVSNVRELMRERGMRKGAGRSWIEVENVKTISSREAR